jgi:hypothetical protein
MLTVLNNRKTIKKIDFKKLAHLADFFWGEIWGKRGFGA